MECAVEELMEEEKGRKKISIFASRLSLRNILQSKRHLPKSESSKNYSNLAKR